MVNTKMFAPIRSIQFSKLESYTAVEVNLTILDNFNYTLVKTNVAKFGELTLKFMAFLRFGYFFSQFPFNDVQGVHQQNYNFCFCIFECCRENLHTTVKDHVTQTKNTTNFNAIFLNFYNTKVVCFLVCMEHFGPDFNNERRLLIIF